MKEVLQVAYSRHLQDFYLFESVKDGIIAFFSLSPKRQLVHIKSFSFFYASPLHDQKILGSLTVA